MIKAINISDEEFSSYNYNPEKELDNLSRVNIFIGRNNSGKSRFLRLLFSHINVDILSTQFDIREFSKNLKVFKDKVGKLYEEYNASILSPISEYLSGIDEIKYLSFETAEKDIKNIIDLLKKIFETKTFQAFKQINTRSGVGTSRTDVDRLLVLITDLTLNFYNETLKDFNTSFEKYERFYVPILRGIRPIQLTHDSTKFLENYDNYSTRTIEDYFPEFKADEQRKKTIFTGLNIYNDIKTQLLNNRELRENIKGFEDFISRTFFENEIVTLIPQVESDVLLVGIGRLERSIHHLGDGIQAIIQLLYPLYMNKGKKAVFLIEEPEISLHPGLQRVLLDALLSDDFKEMQFFITTHSHHFLDLTFDNSHISIYSFSKKDEEPTQIQNLLSPKNHILSELGIRNSSIFLSNCTIWVEGVTDRKYLRKYLEIYSNEHKQYKYYLEDLHYSFIEYAGSNITHWNFDEKTDEEKIDALKINNKVFLIVDSDINSEEEISKKSRHTKLKSALGKHFYITEGKEIENSLTLDIIKKVVSEYEKTKASELKFDVFYNQFVEEKSHNSKGKINKPIYWNRNIGEIIDSGLKTSIRKSKYAKGNSISDKVAFCDKAIKYMKNYSDLSEEAKELSKRIFLFIEECNK